MFLTVSLIGISLPTFLIGILLILMFGGLARLAADLRARRTRAPRRLETGFLTLEGWSH